MPQPDVRVAMAVRLALGIVGTVRVPMMFIVHVAMIVLRRAMFMLVDVAFGEVQPHAGPHQRGGQNQRQR